MNNQDIIKLACDVIRIEAASLDNIVSLLDDNFAAVANKIANTNKLIVSGVGKSGIIGRKIASTFASIGVPSFFMHPGDAMHGDLGMVQSGDICILLSKSGSSSEITELLPFLKRRGSIIVSITGNKNSFLAMNSDYFINSYVEKEGCPIDTAPMASAVVTLAIGDALAASVMQIKAITVEEFVQQHPMGQIGRNISLLVRDVMHTNSQIPVVQEDASLKDSIIEITAKSLGCVCIIDNNGNLSGLITDGDIRRILQTDSDVRTMKAVDLMTKKPICINQNITLGEALSVMEKREHQINVLPVLNDDNKLAGVIRLHDIIRSGI